MNNISKYERRKRIVARRHARKLKHLILSAEPWKIIECPPLAESSWWELNNAIFFLGGLALLILGAAGGIGYGIWWLIYTIFFK